MKEIKPAILQRDHKRIVQEYQEYVQCLEGITVVLGILCIGMGVAICAMLM